MDASRHSAILHAKPVYRSHYRAKTLVAQSRVPTLLHSHHTRRSDCNCSHCLTHQSQFFAHATPTSLTSPMLHQSLCLTLPAGSSRAVMRRKSRPFLGITLPAGVTIKVLSMLKLQQGVTHSTTLSVHSSRATLQSPHLSKPLAPHLTKRQLPTSLSTTVRQ